MRKIYKPVIFSSSFVSHENYADYVEFSIARADVWKGFKDRGEILLGVGQQYTCNWKRCECCDLPIIQPCDSEVCRDCCDMFGVLQ